MSDVSLDQDLRDRWTPSVDQDEQAFEALSKLGAPDTVVTAFVLLDKEQGWWSTKVKVEPVPGLFADRNEASEAAEKVAEQRHKETGLPCTGGYTYHHLPARGQEPSSGDGSTKWKTRWSVYEDILINFPEPSRRKR